MNPLNLKTHRRILATFLLAACTGRPPLVHTYSHVDADGWSRNDTISFDLPPTQADQDCQLNVGFRLTNRYPYTSLWIVVDEQWDGRSVHTDTIEYLFIDSMGDFTGRGVNIYQYEKPIRRLTLHAGAKGRIRLFHIMSRENIPDITDVGVRVTE